MYGKVAPDPRVYGSVPGNPAWYGAAKAGLLQLTRYLAVALAPDRIRVNAISPGPFPDASVAAEAPDFVERLARTVPPGQGGAPRELKGAGVFLATEATPFAPGPAPAGAGGWAARCRFAPHCPRNFPPPVR